MVGNKSPCKNINISEKRVKITDITQLPPDNKPKRYPISHQPHSHPQ